MTSTSEAHEIVAADEARRRDRGEGLGPSNPERVAHHLAVAETSDTLMAQKQKDGFKQESPIRAFTEFRVCGTWAIGKGFRPSLSHLHNYLDAMQNKEGWHLVQMLQGETADPTLIFQRDRSLAFTVPTGSDAIGPFGKDSVLAAPPIVFADDAINPKHYNGRECADIGERLSANGYQILKYCWRLGKKDDPCQELGKALWYLDSEASLLEAFYPGDHKQAPVRPNVRGLAADEIERFLEDRIADQPLFTQNIARMLWQGYGKQRLQAIRVAIDEHRFHLDCGRGLAI